jgi:HSP20 family protein
MSFQSRRRRAGMIGGNQTMSKKKSTIEVKHEKSAPVPSRAENWAPLMSLREEIDRLFDDFGTGFLRKPLSQRMHSLLPAAGSWGVSPAIELAECNGQYEITAELPGIAPENIEIKLSDGMITIRGEKSEEKKEEKDNYLMSERHYGSFHRSLSLPAGVDADAVSASVSNGVLKVTLPKTVEARQKERVIEVKAA